jgi:hypothetical protein
MKAIAGTAAAPVRAMSGSPDAAATSTTPAGRQIPVQARQYPGTDNGQAKGEAADEQD